MTSKVATMGLNHESVANLNHDRGKEPVHVERLGDRVSQTSGQHPKSIQ